MVHRPRDAWSSLDSSFPRVPRVYFCPPGDQYLSFGTYIDQSAPSPVLTLVNNFSSFVQPERAIVLPIVQRLYNSFKMTEHGEPTSEKEQVVHTEHIQQLSQGEGDDGAWRCLWKNPKIVIICLFANIGTLMYGFDNLALSICLSMSPFQ